MTDLHLWLVVAVLSVPFACLLGMFIHEGMRGPEEDDLTIGGNHEQE